MNEGLIGALFAAKEIVGPFLLAVLIIGAIGIAIKLFFTLIQRPKPKKKKQKKEDEIKL